MTRRTKQIVRRVKDFTRSADYPKGGDQKARINRRLQASMVKSSRTAKPGTLAHTIYQSFKNNR